MAWLTGEDLRGRVGFPADLSITEADALAYAAVAAVEAITGPLLTHTATAAMAGNWTHRLNVARRPLTAVTAASIDGLTVATTDLTVMPTGWVIRKSRSAWGGQDALVSVTYTAGYTAAEVPAWLAEMAGASAQRSAGNPGAVTQETVGAYSVTYGSESRSVKLTNAEMHRLRARFGKGVAWV